MMKTGQWAKQPDAPWRKTRGLVHGPEDAPVGEAARCAVERATVVARGGVYVLGGYAGGWCHQLAYIISVAISEMMMMKNPRSTIRHATTRICTIGSSGLQRAKANAEWLNLWADCLGVVRAVGGRPIMPVHEGLGKSGMQNAEEKIANGFGVPVVEIPYDENTHDLEGFAG